MVEFVCGNFNCRVVRFMGQYTVPLNNCPVCCQMGTVAP